jgi:4-hydroxybenzoate polyprenyltransferase
VSDFKFLLKISRPRFWIYAFGPFLIGLVTALTSPAEFLEIKYLLFGIYFLFPANLLIYGINDVFDYETDKLNPKKQQYESLVTPAKRQRLLAYIVLFNSPFAILAFFLAQHSLPALLAFLFFSIFYSAPPIRAKTKPFLDSAFNILYVFPGIFAYLLAVGKYPPVSMILAASLWTAAMHAYSAIPDILSDKEANINTIATFLGPNRTLIFCVICYGVSAATAYNSLGSPALFIGASYLVMMALSYWLSRTNRLFEAYRWFPYLNSLVGFVLFWTIAFPRFVK